MEKLTDEQIIQALECFKSDECLGAECPYASIEGLCGKPMCEDVYDFIYRQKAEIERLKAEIRNTDNALASLDRPLIEVKHEAYNEFADKLVGAFNKDINLYGRVTVYDVALKINTTLKELTGGGN